jgi:hypothetical protein
LAQQFFLAFELVDKLAQIAVGFVDNKMAMHGIGFGLQNYSFDRHLLIPILKMLTTRRNFEIHCNLKCLFLHFV